MTIDPQPRTDRITRWLLIAIGIYSFGLVTLLNAVILYVRQGQRPGDYPDEQTAFSCSGS